MSWASKGRLLDWRKRVARPMLGLLLVIHEDDDPKLHVFSDVPTTQMFKVTELQKACETT